MKKLVIVGASAMGREAYAYAKDAGISVRGFLDSRDGILDGFENYPPIIGTVEEYKMSSGDVFVCAIGDPHEKLRYVETLESRGAKFVTIIHPAAYVGMNAVLGEGCIICPNATITNDVILGRHVILNVASSVNHDCRIGYGTTISPGCSLAGRISIGDRVFIGTGAVVIPDVVLGDDVYVAAGATVTRSFESGRLMGVPAVAK